MRKKLHKTKRFEPLIQLFNCSHLLWIKKCTNIRVFIYSILLVTLSSNYHMKLRYNLQARDRDPQKMDLDKNEKKREGTWKKRKRQLKLSHQHECFTWFSMFISLDEKKASTFECPICTNNFNQDEIWKWKECHRQNSKKS